MLAKFTLWFGSDRPGRLDEVTYGTPQDAGGQAIRGLHRWWISGIALM
jgi:hypothetical protein